MPAGAWRYWLVQAGRGWGKTRTGAQAVIELVHRGYKRIALAGPTAADTRDVMVEGESGILSCSPPWDYPVYEPAKRRLSWYDARGRRRALATLYSADEPERLRGPQHDAAWCDELAAWRYPEAWDQLLFGLRLGRDPRAVVTTTPKPVKFLRSLIANPNTRVTRGSTYENRENLAEAFFSEIIRKYEGTRLGRQELLAEMLDDTPGALWNRDMIEETRVERTMVPPMARVVVAVDPAVSSGPDSNEHGIVVAGLGTDGKVYVAEDATMRGTPAEWGARVVRLVAHYQADRVIGEINNGGELVEANIRNTPGGSAIPYRAVRATRGKMRRAEPVAALYEQGRVKHIAGVDFSALEDQMCTYVAGADDDSPDRLDALVWAIYDLVVAPAEEQAVVTLYDWDAGRISPI